MRILREVMTISNVLTHKPYNEIAQSYLVHMPLLNYCITIAP